MSKNASRGKQSEREKALRREAKAELQKMGVIPPDKPRLNRKRFCEEAKKVLNSHIDSEFFRYYLYWGLAEMLDRGRTGTHDRGRDSEAVGVARAILLAKRRQEFEEHRRAEEHSERYTLNDLYEAVKDVWNA